MEVGRLEELQNPNKSPGVPNPDGWKSMEVEEKRSI